MATGDGWLMGQKPSGSEALPLCGVVAVGRDVRSA